MTLQEGKGKKLYVVGNYRFSGKLLGKGNFARVEEALHMVLNVRVAVKIMDIKQIKEEYVIKNLCREAKLMAKLHHPCVCALYQTMQRSDNVYYLVTELAPGGDLCTFVKEQRGGRLDERLARIYARQFVSALAHMHQNGVVHRDLKMENVMLNSARTQIKIVDFGLSNFYSPSEPLKTHCGSPEYAAPELFVTGMRYGPEVDLWSLGIILYGMVVGQLPFVSNRDEPMTSQERRKRLVCQINKGLSGTHRRALATFSPDFRNMISRMLVADITKRISIRELLVHPFVTEKGTKNIRTDPMKKLDVRHQASVIAEICDLTSQPSDQVIQLIKQEPYSRTGGMYNILAHTFALGRLSGDGVTRPQSTLQADVKMPPQLDSPVKRPYNFRNRSAQPSPGGKGDSYLPRVKVQDRKLSSQAENSLTKTTANQQQQQQQSRPLTEGRRTGTPSTSNRPRTVQPKTYSDNKKLNYGDIKRPFVTRKPSWAGLTPKPNRPATVSHPVGNNKPSISLNTRITKDLVKRLCRSGSPATQTPPEDQGSADRAGRDSIPKSPITGLPNGLRINLRPETCTPTAAPCARAQMAVLDSNKRSKSEKLPCCSRPATTATSSTRKSLLVTTTQSDSKATTNRPRTTNIKDVTTRPFARLLKLSRPTTTTLADQPMEKSTKAYGDSSATYQHQVLQQHHMKKPTIYDPIARSIAGYVANNVPNRLPQFKK